ncbi:hypothetical protein [uncultured Catenibacterium sp.]|uniref:hypothetical protein n=1 Tax=uncultured Catenibacterium sp. TaxID=286142 RepID=UPI0025FD5C52|nr:hypothetical protein [uncultured Catenibacterium sp.]
MNKILVVEDEETILNLIRISLKETGYKVYKEHAKKMSKNFRLKEYININIVKIQNKPLLKYK